MLNLKIRNITKNFDALSFNLIIILIPKILVWVKVLAVNLRHVRVVVLVDFMFEVFWNLSTKE